MSVIFNSSLGWRLGQKRREGEALAVPVDATRLMHGWRGRPHTLPPTRLYLAHLAPYLAEAEVELQAELTQIQAENEDLAHGLQGQRAEVERLVAGLENAVRDLEAANDVMDGVVEKDDLRKDLGQVDEELGSLGREREMKL